jgi:hypothetical protein
MKINCKRLFYGEMKINSVEDEFQRENPSEEGEKEKHKTDKRILLKTEEALRHEKPSCISEWN